jgi:peroxiredoxin
MKTGQKLVYLTFIVLLVATFVLSHPIRVLATEMAGIAASADLVDPVKTGEKVPRFTVRTVDNEPFVFDPDNLDAPVILITFRGGWCPYCNMHLSELHEAVPALIEKGIDVYFLSGDRPEVLYSSLKRETQEDIEGLGYTIFSDANIEAAVALGIAFRASDKTVTYLRKKGSNSDGSSVMNFQVLPVPAVYVIDETGMVTYSFVEPDYKIRLSAEDLLQAAADVSN